jgi:hypothetical protein
MRKGVNRKNLKFATDLFVASAFVFTLTLSGCCQNESVANPTTEPPTVPPATPVPSSPLTEAFPGAGAIVGWTPVGELEVYDSETIFNLVDGQADFFFVYGFEQVAVRRYQNAEEIVLDVQIWQVVDDVSAYGLFSAGGAGEPVAVGNEGDGDAGRRLVFWQDRYVAQLFARKDIPDDDLLSFGEAISAALPAGGERPALVGRLPAKDLVPRSGLFFHEELSIQNEIWLGGENILGLSPDTDGILGRYEIGGTTVRLVLIEYPDADAASAAMAALQDDEVEGLVSSDTNGNLLGAVFGEVNEAAASALVEDAIE